MRHLTHVVAGSECDIFIPETSADMAEFVGWMSDHAEAIICIDTETTGLKVFGSHFGVRLVQFGDTRTAWVIPAQQFAGWIGTQLRRHKRFSAHNFAFDAQVLDKMFGVRIEELTAKVFDTVIMSKLIEPHRAAGHKLKGLAQQYVDPRAADTQDGLEEEFRKLHVGHTKSNGLGWAAIPLDNELYNRYAGLDVIYGARLLEALIPKIKDLQLQALMTFEHTIQGYLNIMRRKGLKVDLAYAAQQRDVFLAEADYHLTITREVYGLENPNSHQQIATALINSGANLTERTDSGAYKTGKEILLPLAGMDEYWGDIEDFENPNELALHLARGQRATRFGNSYLGKFIDLADESGRIHPNITGLEARTSRMAVSDPPLQQLPSKDWKVRRAIVADEGEEHISVDYKQIEMRLLAVMANIPKMRAAIEAGIDLHGYTAELAYGPGYTKAQRTHLKGAGFGIVYGGGAKGLAPKLGIPYAMARSVVNTYNRVYPEIKRYSNRLQREARANGMVMRSPSGRILALDRDRTYAAINYQIQSTAADVLKNALEALFTAGLGQYLLMPIHDEMLAQAPSEDAAEIARAIQETMDTTVMGMHLEADAEVYGFSWGHGYATPEELALPLFTRR